MKVTQCEKCEHYKRKVYSVKFKPLYYHGIGMAHAYGYCELHKDRCLSIKNCNKKD